MSSNTNEGGRLAKKNSSHWSQNLMKSVKNPKMIYEKDDLTTTIKDLFPKARYHYLVCPEKFISNIGSIKKEDLDLLKHMHKVGIKIAEKHKESRFLIGYHSIPSMKLLHLHVISDDFDSPHLKTKKHWNSFTTEFFIPSETVIRELEKNGRLTKRATSDLKDFLQSPLKCHKCNFVPKNMVKLKAHLKTHLKK